MTMVLYHKKDMLDGLPSGWIQAASDLACLHWAHAGDCRGAAVSFLGLDAAEAERALELCRCLGAIPACSGRVAAVLPDPDGGRLRRVAECGVARVRTARRPADLPGVLAAWPGEAVADLLERVCPFLGRSRTNGTELMVCNAYRGVMVLGGARLDRCCLGAGQADCPHRRRPVGPAPERG